MKDGFRKALRKPPVSGFWDMFLKNKRNFSSTALPAKPAVWYAPNCTIVLFKTFYVKLKLYHNLAAQICHGVATNIDAVAAQAAPQLAAAR
jgi:hypothetical protein